MKNEIVLNDEITTRASSGEFSNQFRTGYKVQVSWVTNSQNVANNTSNVTVRAQLVSTGSSYTISSSATKNGSLTINGSTYNFTFNAGLSGGQTKTVYSKTVDIPHNSDGTKTFAISSTLGINVTLSGTYWGNVTANGNGTLNSIPRTSSMSLSTTSIDAGNTITVNINRASTTFTHKVFYTFGSKKITISTNAATSAQYTIPLDHLTVIPNSTSGTATISVDTYSGSTYIGSTSKNFTINVPASVKPSLSSITASVVADGAPTSYGYVKGKSKCALVINGASGSQGSSISGYSISGGGFSSSSQSFTTGKLSSAGDITFTAYITDSRGRRSDSKTVKISVLDYMNPNLLEYSVNRCTSDGKNNDEGTYLNVSAKYTFTKLSGKNNVTNLIEFKPTTSGTWTNAGALTVTTSDSGDIRTVTGNMITGSNGIATDKSFDVKVTLKDNFSDANGINKSIIIPTSFVTMDIKKGGKGIAFGKSAETDNLLEVGMNMKVTGKTTFNGDILVSSPNGSYANKSFIKFAEGDSNGMGVAIQAGGTTVIGGGESANNYLATVTTPADEDMVVCADRHIYLHSRMQDGRDGAYGIRFGNNGAFEILNGYMKLPNSGGSWIDGATKGNIRGTKQSTGSYHPIISQTTSSNHKISLGGLGDEFGFHIYDANRTQNGVDKYFRFRLGDKTIHTDCRIHISEWLYVNGNNGVYFNTHGGGWYMTDGTWVRSYGNKSIYTSNTIRCGTSEQRYLRPEGSSNMDLTVNGGSMYFSTSASSGTALYLNRNWSGSSGTEPSFYNSKGNGWGFIGNSGTSFYRVYGAGGSVSDRTKKYEITKADTETQYENVKDLNVYNYRSISTLGRDLEEIAEDHLRDRMEFYSDKEERVLGTESVIVDDVVYDTLGEDLTQEEIHDLRIKEIVAKNKNIGECNRQDLSLGCMIDEMPLETTFYDNEGGDGKSVDMYSYTTMILGATKHLIGKVETLESENEELQTRLDKMEEILNGIINRG